MMPGRRMSEYERVNSQGAGLLAQIDDPQFLPAFLPSDGAWLGWRQAEGWKQLGAKWPHINRQRSDSVLSRLDYVQ
jgi:hypothetical protein